MPSTSQPVRPACRPGRRRRGCASRWDDSLALVCWTTNARVRRISVHWVLLVCAHTPVPAREARRRVAVGMKSELPASCAPRGRRIVRSRYGAPARDRRSVRPNQTVQSKMVRVPHGAKHASISSMSSLSFRVPCAERAQMKPFCTTFVPYGALHPGC